MLKYNQLNMILYFTLPPFNFGNLLQLPMVYLKFFSIKAGRENIASQIFKIKGLVCMIYTHFI